MKNISTNCPFCDGEVFTKTEATFFTYKGEQVSVNQLFYKCGRCAEEFTDDKLDTETMRQVYFQYWKTHVDDGVLFDNVITDLDKPKTFNEYKYMLEHYNIYTKGELKQVLVNYLNNCELDNLSDLMNYYNEAYTAYKNE